MGSAVLDDIELLVLDEADRMLDMGFRDQVFDITQRGASKTILRNHGDSGYERQV